MEAGAVKGGTGRGRGRGRRRRKRRRRGRGRERGRGRDVGTHTGILLNTLEDAFRRDQEIDEVSQAVATVRRLHNVKHLAEYRGSGGLEGGVQHRQGALDAAIQRLRVLRGQKQQNKT